MAVALYGLVFWIALDLLRPAGVGALRTKRLPAGVWALLALVFVTILSGGFVAGNDAGMIYNTFPLMDGHLVPAGYLDEAPWWRNLFENVATVQFNHRLLGITTFLSALAFAFAAARAGALRSLAAAIAGMALLQAALGISTLLLVVPVPLAAAHQAGAIILLTLVLTATHALRRGASAVKPMPAGARAPTAQTS
jgi:cytochrome c oxidase assembly protein subunit 15